MEATKVGNYIVDDVAVKNAIAHLPEQQKAFANSPSFVTKVEQNLLDMAALATYAEEIGLTESDRYKESMKTAKRDILCQLGMVEVMNAVQLAEGDVDRYYAEHPENFNAPEHAGARHILVETEEEAKDIKAKIESGEMSFEDAAKELSNCPSAEKGGDLGLFTRGQMVPEFDEVCFNEEVGKLHGPVKTQFGYHLIVITERKEAGMIDLEDVRETVEEQLLKARQEEAYNNKIIELRARFGINQDPVEQA